MTIDKSTADRAALTSVEDPEAPQEAHAAMPPLLRRREELGGELRFPLEHGRPVDAAQDGEHQSRRETPALEAEAGVEVDDARDAVGRHQDVVALAEIEV